MQFKSMIRLSNKSLTNSTHSTPTSHIKVITPLLSAIINPPTCTIHTTKHNITYNHTSNTSLSSKTHIPTSAHTLSLISTRTVRLFSSKALIESIVVPELGEDVKEVTFIKWVKQVGDNVEEDDVVCTIETDKVACDVRAPRTGIVTEHKVKEGEKVKIGTQLASMEVQGAAEKSEKVAHESRDAGSPEDRGDVSSGGNAEATVTVASDQPTGKGSDKIKSGRVAAGPHADQFKPASQAKQRAYSTLSYRNTRTYHTSSISYSGAVEGDPAKSEASHGRSGNDPPEAADAAKKQAKQKPAPGDNKHEKTGAIGNPRDNDKFYAPQESDKHGNVKGKDGDKSSHKGPGPGPERRSYSTLAAQSTSNHSIIRTMASFSRDKEETKSSDDEAVKKGRKAVDKGKEEDKQAQERKDGNVRAGAKKDENTDKKDSSATVTQTTTASS